MRPAILSAVGNTPMVEIRRLNPNPSVTLLAKLEFMNPGGSVKDRPALSMIEAGEAGGLLTPDKIVLEATSGNTGIGLAMVCAVKGYRLWLAMSETASRERRQILTAMGAKILTTPGRLGTDGAIEEVYRRDRENPGTYFVVDQFNNPANWKAHFTGTGPEIWEGTGGRVNTVVVALGTAGTAMGISRYLKGKNPNVVVAGVEPFIGHRIQGLKNMKESYPPEIYEKNRLDRIINIDDETAYETARLLARKEGIFTGMSGGAAAAAAIREASDLAEGIIVVILPDGGERYLSTPLFALRETAAIRIFNEMGRKRVYFEPAVSGKAAVFTTGPAARAPLPISVRRRLVVGDLLWKYLTYRGVDVTHLSHLADLDDTVVEAAAASGRPLFEYAAVQVDTIKQALSDLRVDLPDPLPRTSALVEVMIQLAERLVTKGYAYEKLRSLYFDISRLPAYGMLTGVDTGKLRSGATVDLDAYEKANPRDFTLFKRSRLAELKRGDYLQTPWGNARPSWHLQAVAAAAAHLGDRFDIHVGSREAAFPHHENEVALSLALTGRPQADYWLLCGPVAFEGAESTLIPEEIDSPRALRFAIISVHYRKRLQLSYDRLSAAKRSLKRLDDFIRTLSNCRGEGEGTDRIDQILFDIRQGFGRSMDDDLNVPSALSSLFQQIRRVHKLIDADRINAIDARRIRDAFASVDAVLGIMDPGAGRTDAEVEALIEKRTAARRAGRWDEADRIREILVSRGVTLRDSKTGRSKP